MKLTKSKIVLLAVALATMLLGGSALVRSCVSDAAREGFSFPPTSANAKIIVNVKSYGAKGDGVTDDRVAITSAMTAACATGASELFFPPGTYIVSRSGLLPFSLDLSCDNIALVGVHGRSILKHPTGMTTASVSVLRIYRHKNVVIRDLVFDGNWGNCATEIWNPSNNVALSSVSTINVKDATCWPTSGISFVVGDNVGTEYVNCTGRTSTSFTGCTALAVDGVSAAAGTLFVGQHIGMVDANAGINQATQTNANTVSSIASGSNGQSLPQATINLVDATAFATACGTGDCFIRVKTTLNYQVVNCTGSNATQLTGCTGGVGAMATGNEVYKGGNAQNYLLFLRGPDHVWIEDTDFQQAYGDCIWMGSSGTSGYTDWTTDVHIHNVTCRMSGRDGIALGSGVDGLYVDNFVSENIFGQAFDAEPIGTFVRNINLDHSVLDTWFNKENASGGNPLSIVGGGTTSWPSSSDAARGWRVTNNLIRGVAFVERTQDVYFAHNRMIGDFAGTGSGALLQVEFGSNNLRIEDNYFYSRMGMGTAGYIDGNVNTAVVSIWTYQSGAIRNEPSNVVVARNHIDARNGRDGILIKGAGGTVEGDSGTATTITASTLVDTTKSWTTSQWAGFLVRIGGVISTVESNTSNTLTLDHAYGNNSGYWVDGLGNQAGTPSTGAYSILRETGLVDVRDNTVDLKNDGRGAGNFGINVTRGPNNAYGMRVRLQGNKIRDCTTHGLHFKWGTTAFPYVEIVDNYAWDDQPTKTCTNVLGFETVGVVPTKFIMGGNIKGEGVTNILSGLSSGTWLARDGTVQDWTGFGSPVSVVTAPIGSTYQQIDGGVDTALWVKTGSGITAWNKRGQIEHLITGEGGDGHHDARGISPTLTLCGTSPAITGDDLSGTVTEGTGATGCVITFHTAYSTAASCTVTSEAGLGFTYIATSGAITLNNVGALSSTKLDYHCNGH